MANAETHFTLARFKQTSMQRWRVKETGTTSARDQRNRVAHWKRAGRDSRNDAKSRETSYAQEEQSATRGNEQINSGVTPRLKPRYNLRTKMRERVLAFVGAIVKSAHLNMNKSFAQSVCARPCSSIRSYACPFVHRSVRRNGGGVSVGLSGGVFYTCAFMDCLMAAAYKLDER